jgi:hypothetical protein
LQIVDSQRKPTIGEPGNESDDDEREQPAQMPEPFVTTFDCEGCLMRMLLSACSCYVTAGNLLPAWSETKLHPQLAATLYSQKFLQPTAIQSAALPPAMAGRDVIGVAETVHAPCLANW